MLSELFLSCFSCKIVQLIQRYTFCWLLRLTSTDPHISTRKTLPKHANMCAHDCAIHCLLKSCLPRKCIMRIRSGKGEPLDMALDGSGNSPCGLLAFITLNRTNNQNFNFLSWLSSWSTRLLAVCPCIPFSVFDLQRWRTSSNQEGVAF
jgi:hypothetical protein